MSTNKRVFGFIGISSVVIFLVVSIISILGFENGTYSPASCFVCELGMYSGTFLSGSLAMVYNLALIVSGLLFCVFMVNYGIAKNAGLWTAASFFGIIVGILIAAQGVFNLNYMQYHIIVSIAFFVSALVMLALFVIASMRDRQAALANIIVAFIGGVLNAVFAVFMITGGMQRVFAEDAAGVGRLSFNPFALIEWGAFVAIFALIALLSIQMISSHKSAEQRVLKKPRKSDIDVRSLEL